MNYRDFGFPYGRSGSFPVRQDRFVSQSTTPRLNLQPTYTQMELPFHSTPVHRTLPNFQSARITWQADNLQLPTVEVPEVSQILPAHGIHTVSSIPLKESALDLTVYRPWSGPDCMEAPIDMTMTSKVVSDQGDAPLALTKKTSQDQTTITDDTQNHAKRFNRKLQKSKHLSLDDAHSSASSFHKLSKTSVQVSDAAAFDISPRRVTRQSVRSGQAALTSSAASHLSPASTMEAVEGLLMLPQLAKPDASSTALPAMTLRPLRIPRKALRPVRLQTEYAAQNSAIFSTPSGSSCRLSTGNTEDNLTCTVSSEFASEVQPATENQSSIIQSTGDFLPTNALGSAVLDSSVAPLPVVSKHSMAAVETCETGSVVMQTVTSVTDVVEATQSLKEPGSEMEHIQENCVVMQESFCQTEDSQENSVSESLVPTTNCLSHPVVGLGFVSSDTSCLPSDGGSVSPDTDSMPSDTLCMPSDTGSMPPDTMCMPSDAGSVPSNALCMTPDTAAMPSDTLNMPTDGGSTPPDAGSMPSNAGSVPHGMPSNTGLMPSDPGSMSSDPSSMPSDSGSMPSNAGSIAEPPVDIDKQIASLASLDLNQTKKLILSLYRHLETLERTHLAGNITERHAKNNQVAELHDMKQCQHDTSHDLPVTQASSSRSDNLSPELKVSGTTGDTSADGINSDIAVTSHNKTVMDISVVELNTLTTDCEDDGQSVNEVVSSEGAEASNANPVKETIPSDSKQLPVQVTYGVPPFEPVVMTSDGGLVEIPSGYIAVPFSAIGEGCPHHKQQVIILVNSPQYLEATAFTSQHQDPLGPHALTAERTDPVEAYSPPNQQVTPVQPQLLTSQEVSFMEPLSLTSQQVTPVEPHLYTCQQVTRLQSHSLPSQQVTSVQPHVHTSQQLSLLEPHSTPVEPCLITSLQVLPLEPHLVSSQQVSPLSPLLCKQVSVLEPTVFASQQVTTVQPHLLTIEQVTIMEPHSITSHQVVPLKPHLPTSQHLSQMELMALSSHQVVSLEPASPEDQQVFPLEPHLVSSKQVFQTERDLPASQRVSPLETETEQDGPLPGVVPLMKEAREWVISNSYQSSLKLETISPPASVLSMNNVEDTAENAESDVFESTEELDRNSTHPSLEVCSADEKEELVQMETDEASGGVENDSLAQQVQRSQSLGVSISSEDIMDKLEQGRDLHSEVVQFNADDPTEVLAEAQVETDDLDDEESQERLSLRLSISSEEDITDLVEKPSDFLLNRNQSNALDLAADRSCFDLLCSNSTQPDETRIESDSQESTDAMGSETEIVARAVVSNKDMTADHNSVCSDSSATLKHEIQDARPEQSPQDIASINSNDNLIELCAEQLGTSVRVNPSLLPKDITALFNCSVVIKMLKLSHSPGRKTKKKKKKLTNKHKRQRKAQSQRGSSINVSKTDEMVRISEASVISQANKQLEENFGKPGKGFWRRSCPSAAGEAATEASFAKVQYINDTQSSHEDGRFVELVGTGLIKKVGDSFKPVHSDPAFKPNAVLSTVHLHQADENREEDVELAVGLSSKANRADVAELPLEVNMDCTDNSRTEQNEETELLAYSLVPNSLNHKHVAEPVKSFPPVGGDSATVPTLDVTAVTSSFCQPSSDTGRSEKSHQNSRGDRDSQKISKKVCKISLSGLSKPPQMDRLSLCSASTGSLKTQGDLGLSAINTSRSVLPGSSLDQQESWTQVLEMNPHREATAETRSTGEEEVTAQDKGLDRNIFLIKIPLITETCQETVTAKQNQSETPESVSHDGISKMVLTLRTIFQEVPPKTETRDKLIQTASETSQYGLSSCHKPCEMALSCGETTAQSHSYQFNDLSDREGVASADVEGSQVVTQDLHSQTEETADRADDMLISLVRTVNSSETKVSSSETTVSSSEMLDSSGETPVNSVETVAMSDETLAISGEKVTSSSKILDRSGELLISSGETVERSLGSSTDDDDDDNENRFSELDDCLMEQDNASEMTFDSTVNLIGRCSGCEETSPDSQHSKCKRKPSTNPNVAYPAQRTRGAKRLRLTELNCGLDISTQPTSSIVGQESKTAFSGTNQNQVTVAHSNRSSPRSKAMSQIVSERRKAHDEPVNRCRVVVLQAGGNNKQLPSSRLRCEQSKGPSDDRFSRTSEDSSSKTGLNLSDPQSGNRDLITVQPEPSCLWEFSDTAETGIASSPNSPRRKNQRPRHENSHTYSPKSLAKPVEMPLPPVSRRPTDSTSLQSSISEDLTFTSSNVQLLDSLNNAQDVVVRKMPIYCPVVSSTMVSVVSRAVSSSMPGIKHLQCVFCQELAPAMKDISAHLEQHHADIAGFAVSKVKPSQDFSICYFCRHCQFVTTDRVVMWIHFQATHNILGILESCHDSRVSEPSAACSTELNLSLNSPVYCDRVFMCPECNGLTDDEETVALHMTTVCRCSSHSNGHFVKVIALFRPRSHSRELTHRMLLMDAAYSKNRKTCFVCSFCHFVVFDPRLALSHFILLHSDMKLLLVCSMESCDKRFVREKAFVEHYQECHKPKTVPMHFNCSVTLVKKSFVQGDVTEVAFMDED